MNYDIIIGLCAELYISKLNMNLLYLIYEFEYHNLIINE